MIICHDYFLVIHSCPQESSCCYWPQELREAELYGKLRVTLKRVNSHGDLVDMKLELVESGPKSGQASQPRIVTLLQLTSWPPHGVPHPTAILTLIKQLSKAQRTSSGKYLYNSVV